MKKITLQITALTLLIPAISFAALDGLRGLLIDIQGLLKLVYPIVFTIALIYFFWGVAQFILKEAGNDKAREDGKKKIMWGVVALFVMFSIYGIISAISNLTGIPTTVSGGNLNSRSFSPSELPGSVNQNGSPRDNPFFQGEDI